ncbi:neprilysin-1-like isoform X2 [Penaeus japonicus]|uniref:neprilysin-1-like isoform X2 n=1 Tax=Penaeus japonicus TaxID=27405 RepID=UPI001C712656|nr:neprilysin-1-like isoform X2 [Penaeus japonicus]
MASLREHVEMKEQPSFVDIALNESGSPPPPRSSSPLSITWRKGTAVAIVCAVAVVATVATLAIVVPGGGSSASGTTAKSHPDAHLDRQMIGDSAGLLRGSNVFKQLLSGLLTASKENEHGKHAPQESEDAKQAITEPDFIEVQEPLQRDEDHEGGSRPYPPSRSQDSFIPPDPDFKEEPIELENPIEHDQPRRKEGSGRGEGSGSEGEEEEKAGKEREQRDAETKVEGEEKERKEAEAKKDMDTTATKVEEPAAGEEVPQSLESPHSKEVLVCETPECAVAASQISESLDLSTNPCEDFFQFACGGWIDKHPIPDEGATGTFYEAGDVLGKRLHLIVETPVSPGEPEPLHMVNRFYSSCMDTDTMDSLGLAPLVASLSSQGGWPMVSDDWDSSSFNLASELVHLRSINVYPVFGVGVDANIFNVSRRVIYVEAGTVPLGIGLMSQPTDALLNAYRTFMTDAAKELRAELGSSVTDDQIATQVQEVIDFEIAFARLVIESSNEATDNGWQTDVSGIQADLDDGVTGQFNFLAFLKEMFTNTEVMINENEPVISFKSPFFANLTSMLANTPPRTVANAIGWWWVYDIGQETTYALRNITFNFQQALTGATEPTPRASHCLAQANINLGFALSRAYVDRFFPATAKEETSELVEDLRAAFDSLLDENEWMLEEDLVVAREKLAAIDPFVAYPEWIMDDAELTNGYEGLEILSGQEYNNLLAIGIWFDRNSLASLRETPMHSFLFPPTVVNAFYNPQENTITILAGILQPPFYAHNTLAALNYGGIGMVIGHEMTHGFDNTGRLFDKQGNLIQWWSDETIAAYDERAKCFVDQYNGFVPPELSEVGLNYSVNGLQTEGENIADNGGIREAYKAYQLFVERHGEEPRLPGLDEFTPDHLFYLGFANVWCEHKNAQAVLAQLAADPHSPGRFRVLGSLSNDAEFSRVWNCPSESAMNRGDERCLLW